jgi:hypothetical protein
VFERRWLSLQEDIHCKLLIWMRMVDQSRISHCHRSSHYVTDCDSTLGQWPESEEILLMNVTGGWSGGAVEPLRVTLQRVDQQIGKDLRVLRAHVDPSMDSAFLLSEFK